MNNIFSVEFWKFILLLVLKQFVLEVKWKDNFLSLTLVRLNLI